MESKAYSSMKPRWALCVGLRNLAGCRGVNGAQLICFGCSDRLKRQQASKDAQKASLLLASPPLDQLSLFISPPSSGLG